MPAHHDYRDLQQQLSPALAPLAAALLQQFDAPENLHYLVGAVSGLVESLPHMKAIARLSDDEWEDEVEIGAEAIRAMLQGGSAACPFEWVTPSSRVSSPMHGVIEDHQLYVLPAYSAEQTLATRFAQLKAQTIFAALRLRRTARQAVRGPGTAIAQGAQGARLLLRSRDLLKKLPETALSGSAYLTQIAEILQESRTGGVKHLEQVQSLLRQCWATEASESVAYNADAFENDGTVRIAVRQYISGPTARIREARRSGLALAELADEDEFFHFEESVAEPPSPPEATLPELVLRRRHQLVQLERTAQLLSVGWQRLTLPETAQIIRAVHRLLAAVDLDTGDPGTPSDADIAAAAALTVIFWMSRTYEDALTLQLYRSQADLPQRFHLRRLAYVLDSNEWCVPAIRPKGAPRFLDVDRTAACPVSPIVVLPAPTDATTAIHRLPAAQRAYREGSAFAFPGDLTPLRQRLDETLKDLAATSRGQVSLPRMRDHLFLTVIDKTRDVALASMLFERAHALGDTQLHYTAFSVPKLASIYTEVCTGLQDAAHSELHRMYPTTTLHPAAVAPERSSSTAGPPSSPPSSFGSARVGSPICPTPASVHELVASVRRARAAATAVDDSFSVVVELHNRLNLYASLLLKFGLGLRDVVGPVPRWTAVDFEDATIIVSDKDDAASFSTRLLPLPQVIAQQLKLLREHWKAMIPGLAVRAPQIAKDMVATLRGETIKQPLPIVFFLTEDQGKSDRKPASGALLSRLVAEHAPSFNLPGNANRHFLRSSLLDAGCPAVAVDYMLGHWRRGTEPMGRFATLDLEHYLSLLRVHLHKMLHAAGWRPLTGLQ